MEYGMYTPIFELSNVTECKKCNQPFLQYFFRRQTTGNIVHQNYCTDCRKKPQKYLPKALRDRNHGKT